MVRNPRSKQHNSQPISLKDHNNPNSATIVNTCPARRQPRRYTFTTTNATTTTMIPASPTPSMKKRLFGRRRGTSSSSIKSDLSEEDDMVGCMNESSTRSSFRCTGNIIVELDADDLLIQEEQEHNQNTSFRSLPPVASPTPTPKRQSSLGDYTPGTSRRQATLRKMLFTANLDATGGGSDHSKSSNENGGGDGGTCNGNTNRRMSLRQLMLARYATGMSDRKTLGGSSHHRRTPSLNGTSSHHRRRSSSTTLYKGMIDEDDHTEATEELTSMDFTLPSPTSSPPGNTRTKHAAATSTLIENQSGSSSSLLDPEQDPKLMEEMESMRSIMLLMKDRLGFNPIEISSPGAWREEDEEQAAEDVEKPEEPTMTSTTTPTPSPSAPQDDTGCVSSSEDEELVKEQQEMQNIARQLKDLIGFDPETAALSNHPVDKSMLTLEERVAQRVAERKAAKRFGGHGSKRSLRKKLLRQSMEQHLASTTPTIAPRS